MAVTDLTELVRPLRANLKDIDSELTDDELLDLLIDGLNKYNDDVPRPFDEDDGVLDREADRNEKRYLVLCGIWTFLTRRMIGSSETAINESNVAGRTDTTTIELALAKRRKEILDADMKPALDRLTRQEIAAESRSCDLTAPVELGVTGWPLF